MKCCMGQILEVDLTSKTIEKKKIPDLVYEQLLSGKGLGVWYLLNHVPETADPLGPDNVLGFVSGALTGTGALMCGRWMAVTKSPLTGGWGDANCGGFFSPAIKQCGVDAIFVKGISDSPVYLYVDNTKAELRDASQYWGLDATVAEEKLTADNWKNKKPVVALIGQAGENLSLISGICSDGGRIAARSGVGAVMGSKRLKAVVLAGSKPIRCDKPEKMKEMSKQLGSTIKNASIPNAIGGGLLSYAGILMGKLPSTFSMDGATSAPLLRRWGTPMNTGMALGSGDAPVKNWVGSSKDAIGAAKAFNPDTVVKNETSKYHCYSCALGCGGHVDTSRMNGGVFPHTHKPEYETIDAFGPLLLNNNLDSIFYINELLNRAGMDSISAGNVVAYAIECFEEGLISIKDTQGLELYWGNYPDIVKLIEKMIARSGIGDILADGVKKASEHFGESTKKFAMQIGGQEPAMHDPRNDPQLAVHYVADPAPGKHTIGMGMMYGAMSLCDICTWAPPSISHKKKEDLVPSKNIGVIAKANACYSMLVDGAGGCYYAEMMGVHSWKLIEYLNAASGWEKSGDEYMEVGNRIQTMKQMFNVKHGIEPATWMAPDRMEGKPPLKSGPLKGITLSTKEQIKYHWEAFGWDRDTGIPMAETLEHLGIPELLNLEEVRADGKE